MNNWNKYTVGLLFIYGLIFIACERNNRHQKVEIPNFNFPETITFKDSLSSYNVFQGEASQLIPSEEFQLYELSSSLFTDYAHKQRLIYIPSGSQIEILDDQSLNFPNETVLTKTFYYYHDETDTSKGKNIIETRLLIKSNDQWNIASYIWNASQTDALLAKNGSDIDISWINSSGQNFSTLYHVPSQNECMTCHQSNESIQPIGPTIRNLNRTITRSDESTYHQLQYLQDLNLLENFNLNNLESIVDYENTSASIENRARAYLDINCAHCHQANAWDEASKKDFDFQYSTALKSSGIERERKEIIKEFSEGDMPFIGTTLLHQEGLDILKEYFETLNK